jgi:hypothetical protein
MFVAFITTIFVFSLVTTLLFAGFVACVSALFMAGFALLILVPTIFLTTMGACFLFAFGLGSYYLLKLLKNPRAAGQSIGSRSNNLTNGATIGKEETKLEPYSEKSNGGGVPGSAF